MNPMRDGFLVLDRRRTQLERSVADLQNVLSKWHAWNAEYEALKEEVSALGSSPSSREMERVGTEFDGIVLTPKEVRNIMLDGRKRTRSVSQVLNVLSHRIEYVEGNIGKLEKQIMVAEEKLLDFNVMIQPELRNEDGLRLTEIREELDDEGNVVSSSILNPAEAASPVLDALRKAGIDGMPVEKRRMESNEPKEEGDTSTTPTEERQAPVTPTEDHQSHDLDPASAHWDTSNDRISRPRKKSVTFAQDTKHGAPIFSPLTKRSSAVPSPVKSIMKTSPERRPLTDRESNSPEIEEMGFRSEIIIPEVSTSAVPSEVSNVSKDSEVKETSKAKRILSDTSGSTVVTPTTAAKSLQIPEIRYPTNESPEEAALRRQMLQYSFEDLGAVVAELNLDNSDESSQSDESTADDESDEDAFGRSKYRSVDEDYKQEMLKLQKKLQGHTIENVGPELATDSNEDSQEATSTAGDITAVPPMDPTKMPLADQVLERISSSKTPTEATSSRQSRFKASRTSNPPTSSLPTPSSSDSPLSSTSPRISSSTITNGPLAFATKPINLQPASSSKPRPFSGPIDATAEDDIPPRRVPEGPPGKIHADVIEREPGKVAATAPDDYDPALVRQELAVEYHRLRNRFMYKQNGFSSEEAAEEPIHEGPKVSRFRAARLTGTSISGSH